VIYWSYVSFCLWGDGKFNLPFPRMPGLLAQAQQDVLFSLSVLKLLFFSRAAWLELFAL